MNLAIEQVGRDGCRRPQAVLRLASPLSIRDAMLGCHKVSAFVNFVRDYVGRDAPVDLLTSG